MKIGQEQTCYGKQQTINFMEKMSSALTAYFFPTRSCKALSLSLTTKSYPFSISQWCFIALLKWAEISCPSIRPSVTLKSTSSVINSRACQSSKWTSRHRDGDSFKLKDGKQKRIKSQLRRQRQSTKSTKSLPRDELQCKVILSTSGKSVIAEELITSFILMI